MVSKEDVFEIFKHLFPNLTLSIEEVINDS